MKFIMNKKTTSNRTDAYSKLMLYSIVEKFLTLNDVFLPEYKRFMKSTNLSLSKLYHVMRSVTRKLAHKLRRTGVLVVTDTHFAGFRNRIYTFLPYNKKCMLLSLAIDLYKISKFKDVFEGPFCSKEFDFNFDFSILNKRDIYVRVGEVDMSLINSNRTDTFDQLKKQAEQAFKKVETKPEMHLYLSQFFNLQEDINDCFNLAKQIAC
jgi:hypothetical protein